jgi:D-3-phosphoglycerate dehydrogenase / 2-oxoglutarate reductase
VLIAPADYRRYAPEACHLLEEAGATLRENPNARPWSQAELAELVGDVDAAVVGVEVWDESILARAPRLRTLTKLGVGVDNIDLGAAAGRGIAVTNAPGGNANAVAEFTVGLVLAALRSIPQMQSALREGRWPRLVGRELTGRTVGLIGFGRIGQLVAQRLRGFEVTILAYDPFPDHQRADDLGVALADRDAVLAASDIVSVHLPSTPETKGSASTAFFAAMKDGAWFVNTARGALVDEPALLTALDSGRLAGAALDVFCTEPVDPADPLVRHPRVLATTHGAADTLEAYRAIGLLNARSILDVAVGERPRHLVTA